MLWQHVSGQQQKHRGPPLELLWFSSNQHNTPQQLCQELRFFVVILDFLVIKILVLTFEPTFNYGSCVCCFIYLFILREALVEDEVQVSCSFKSGVLL